MSDKKIDAKSLKTEPQISQEVTEIIEKIKKLKPTAVHQLLTEICDYYLIDIKYSASFKSGQERNK